MKGPAVVGEIAPCKSCGLCAEGTPMVVVCAEDVKSGAAEAEDMEEGCAGSGDTMSRPDKAPAGTRSAWGCDDSERRRYCLGRACSTAADSGRTRFNAEEGSAGKIRVGGDEGNQRGPACPCLPKDCIVPHAL